MNIPNRVKIGGFTYIVERPESAFVGSGSTLLDGEHSFTDKYIKVSKGGCQEYQNVVFLHEVCHAIIAHYTPIENQDEDFVEQFSKGLYQFLVDNQDIFTHRKGEE